MLTGKKFLITGLSRLSVRVARALHGARAEVTVILLGSEDERLRAAIAGDVSFVQAGSDIGDALRSIDLADVSCLLALDDNDLENIHAAVAAREVASDLPVVVRTFDPALADQLESGLNVRRAYSVSALAAPAFVAAAFGDDVIETMRLADTEAPLCRITVRAGSPLVGLDAAQVKSRYGCALLAMRLAGGWESSLGAEHIERALSHSGAESADQAPIDRPLTVGQELLIGGLLADVLRVLSLNAEKRPQQTRAGGLLGGVVKRAVKNGRHSTRLPQVAFGLFLVLLVAIGVFRFAMHLSLVDAIYFVITTATTTGYGDISVANSPAWIKLFDCLVMISGGALLGVLFSYLASVVTAERLDETMGLRAGRMKGHIVISGLGNLGYRVVRELTDQRLDVVVIELNADARFMEAVRARTPALVGDTRLPENLDRASIRQASAFIACTNNDLANIQACLNARRLNPEIRTVARIADDILAARLSTAMRIDRTLSATQAATGAFVGAATDERALRPVRIGDLALLSLRFTVATDLTEETVRQWRETGVRIVAFRRLGEPPQAPSAIAFPLSSGDELIICGPPEAVQQIIE